MASITARWLRWRPGAVVHEANAVAAIHGYELARPISLLLCLGWLLLGLAGVSRASTAQAEECIGLVLGGGGARGAAHIGVLKVLERERVPICAIAGTSMGAIVGGLYATGYSPDAIARILAGIDWKEVLDDDPARASLPMRRKQEDFRFLLDFKLGLNGGRIQLPRGLIQGQKLNLLLRRLLLPAWHVEDFDQLPTRFRCVGTDIGRGEGVVFASGDLAMAVRASMSVPGAFAPIRLDGRLMVDGGIYNNLPVDVVRDMGATRVIVVDVGAPLEAESELDSPFAISMQMLTMLMNQRTAVMLESMQQQDLLIRPQLGRIGSADFELASQAVAPGIEAAEQQIAAIRRLAIGPEAYAARQRARGKLAFDAPLVAFVEVLGNGSRTHQYVEDRVEGLAGQALDVDRVERSIGDAYGQGSYEHIGWDLVDREGRTGIEIFPVDKGWGPNFLTFALQVSDDFEGGSDYALAVETSLSGFNARGGEWLNRVEFGRATGFRSEFHQPWGRHGRWFVQPGIYYRELEQPLNLGDATFAEYRLTERGLVLAAGVALGRADEIGARFVRGRDSARLRIGSPQFPASIREGFAGVGLQWRHDSLDNADFPHQGRRISASYDLYRSALGGEAEGETFRWIVDHGWTRGRHSVLLGTRGTLRRGDPGSLVEGDALGGLTNLSSRGERALVGQQAAIARAIYYRRFGDMARLFSVPAFIGGSLEAGNIWDQRADIGSDLIHAGSVFVGLDSPFGPILFGYGLDDDGERALHLTFGSMLRP